MQSASCNSSSNSGREKKNSREAPTLTKLCVKSIARHINLWCEGIEEFHLERCRFLLTAFDEYNLPDHLALEILNALAYRRKLTLSNFVLFLNSSLMQLDLHKCGGFITDHFIRQIAARAHQLRRLNLATCYKITNPAVLDLVRRLRHLQAVDLSGCTKLQDSAIEALAEASPGIKSLRLIGVNRVGDGALQRVAARLASIEELDLTNCPRVTDRSAAPLFEHCPRLTKLSLSGCWEVSDVSFGRIALQVGLEHIDVAVSAIGDTGLAAIRATCRRLRVLNLEGCTHITDAAFVIAADTIDNSHSQQQQQQQRFGDHLETLKLGGCSGITERGIVALFVDRIGNPASLRTVHLPQTLTDAALVLITHRLRHVESLDLEGCTALTERAFRSYPPSTLTENDNAAISADGSRRWRDVELVGNYLATTERLDGSQLWFPLCGRLRRLNCKGCERLTDAALACLAGHAGSRGRGRPPMVDAAPADIMIDNDGGHVDDANAEVTLEELSLEGCERITDGGLRHLRRCVRLRALDLSNCIRVTRRGVTDLLLGGDAFQLLLVEGDGAIDYNNSDYDNHNEQPYDPIDGGAHYTRYDGDDDDDDDGDDKDDDDDAVDEEGELPWALVRGGAEVAAAAAAMRQRRNHERQRRRQNKQRATCSLDGPRKVVGHKQAPGGRSSLTQLNLGGCARISRAEWEDARRRFPGVALAWH